MRDTPRVTPFELMTDYIAAARRGDWDTALGYFADDIVFHIPGRSSFASASWARATRSRSGARTSTASRATRS
jgi:ketosteroid isomerase-like protein